MALVELTERLYDLRRDRSSGYEKPYKPALLLSLIDLIQRGDILRNRIQLTDALIERYKGYIAIVGTETDNAQIAYPFWHLAGDGIWMLFDAAGAPLYGRGSPEIGAVSVARIRERVAYASLHEDLFLSFNRPVERALLRNALISRYFAKFRNALRASIADFLGRPSEDIEDAGALANDPVRSAAFSKTVKSVYDHKCAACGIRLRFEDSTLVDACHLIPFSETYNDHPSNGIALCKNHHWALDRHLIAPECNASKLIWRASPRLDDRIDDQSDLIKINGKSVLLPSESEFHPAPESIDWRTQHLLA